jgi:hypothetical protein
MNRVGVRRWVGADRWFAVVGAVISLTAGATSAGAAAGNLLTNGDFETGTTHGWAAYNGTIAAVSGDGVGGSWAGKATNGTAANFGIRTPSGSKPVTNGTAGTAYAATAMLRSDTPGKQVCIYLTEYNPSGSQIGQSKACSTSTSSWTAMNTATRTLTGSGGSLTLAVREASASAGDSFKVDNLSLAVDGSSGPRVVALWNMNDASGPMLDSGLAPTNNGTLSASGIIRGVAGVSGTAYSFTKGWVTVPSEPSLNPGTAPITIRASLAPTSLPTSGDFDIIRKGDYPSQLYKMELLPSGALFCQFKGTGGQAAATSTNLIAPNNGFHTVVCTKTGSTVQAVVDGVVTSKSANVGSISNTAPVPIGAHTGGSNDFYKGVMDEVSITIG